jgi:hypothetical protein
MSKTYEAIYKDGHLQWLGAQPRAGRHRLRITIIAGTRCSIPPRRCIACWRRHGVPGVAGRHLRTLMRRLAGCGRSGIGMRGAYRLKARL